jgi:hypothetical protein
MADGEGGGGQDDWGNYAPSTTTAVVLPRNPSVLEQAATYAVGTPDAVLDAQSRPQRDLVPSAALFVESVLAAGLVFAYTLGKDHHIAYILSAGPLYADIATRYAFSFVQTDPKTHRRRFSLRHPHLPQDQPGLVGLIRDTVQTFPGVDNILSTTRHQGPWGH